jgi:hypothetical protein
VPRWRICRIACYTILICSRSANVSISVVMHVRLDPCNHFQICKSHSGVTHDLCEWTAQQDAMAGRIWAEVTALAYSACSSAACMCACGVDVGADSVSYFFPTWNFFLIDLCCPTVFADSLLKLFFTLLHHCSLKKSSVAFEQQRQLIPGRLLSHQRL